MRIFWVALAVLLYIGGLVLVSFALLTRASDSDEASLLGSMIAVGLVLPPVFAGVGSALSAMDAHTTEGRQARTRFLLAMVGMQLVVTVGLAFYGVAFGLPVGIVVALPFGAVALTAVFFAIGSRIHRPTDDAGRSEAASHARPFTRTEVAARMRRVVVTVVVVFVVMTGGISALVFSLGVSEAGFPEPWLLSVACFSLGFALLCGGGAAVVVSFRMLGMLQHQGRTLSERRAIGRAVLKNLPDSLAEESRVPAARYAALYSAYLPFQWAQLGLLFGGLLLLQATSMLGGSGAAPSINQLVLIVGAVAMVFLAVVLPRQARKVRRYAANSAHLLEPDRDATAGFEPAK